MGKSYIKFTDLQNIGVAVRIVHLCCIYVEFELAGEKGAEHRTGLQEGRLCEYCQREGGD